MEEIHHQMLYVESSIFARARVSYANEDGVSCHSQKSRKTVTTAVTSRDWVLYQTNGVTCDSQNSHYLQRLGQGNLPKRLKISEIEGCVINLLES